MPAQPPAESAPASCEVRKWHYPLPARSPAEVAGDRAIRRLHEAGYESFRVGGCVRDRLLGRPAKDVDVTTAAPPAVVTSAFPQTYAVGAKFGVVVVHMPGGIDIEVATFRSETGYADGRRPDTIAFSSAPVDSTRRDFTINALYYDPETETIHDYHDGLADLRRGLIRCIGDPARRFAEDYLRMLRAVRFAAEFRLRMDPETRGAILPLAYRLAEISAERVRDELTRMLTGHNPAGAFRDLMDLGLLRHWLPEVQAMAGIPQPPEYHPEGDVWVHTLLLLHGLRAPSPELGWAALLHDVGKPPTLEDADTKPRFPCHAQHGAGMARDILTRLRTSRNLRDAVHDIVRNHMAFADLPRMKRSTVRRLLVRPTFPHELELHRLDCRASHGKTDNYCLALDRMHEFANEPVLPPPLLTGADVLAHGIPSGPRIGNLLQQARELQLEGRLTTRDKALAWLDEQVQE